ncbi:hypothetical protein NLJ89_g7328 [Agrocybe chaxingu]|uniref:Coiled-coil domain-containing protein 174 n=1 Tax=Agrocybe chaxingu TaxID=84603 RepID=A0A9W8MRV2_9AGAR|nr:hypothetical protein NLJ89_g7328 [Agrocybe chaxingu]
MSSSRAKAKGVSASSFFDLKAELSRQELEFARAKAEGKSLAVVGGIKRPDKKPTVWARQNKGVKARANRDVELEEISKPTLDSARAALERKAQIYEKLRRGKTGGLNDAQYDALLVDFDSNPSTSKYYQGHSSDEDESSTVPKAPTSYENDPIVEYEDEFGRIRSARRSEVPRNLVLDQEDEQEDDEDLIRNPVNHFPTYQPSEDRIAEIEKAYAEENNPLNVHYDASREVRAKGAAFYQFSGDEETRRQQMEEMKASREETERMRRDLGSEDVKPGEVEGMQDDSGNAGEGVARSRAMEKRKREIEERRKILDAKRRKLKKSGTPETSNAPTSTPTTMTTTTTTSGEERGKTTSSVSDDPLPLWIRLESPASKCRSLRRVRVTHLKEKQRKAKSTASTFRSRFIPCSARRRVPRLKNQEVIWFRPRVYTTGLVHQPYRVLKRNQALAHPYPTSPSAFGPSFLAISFMNVALRAKNFEATGHPGLNMALM